MTLKITSAHSSTTFLITFVGIRLCRELSDFSSFWLLDVVPRSYFKFTCHNCMLLPKCHCLVLRFFLRRLNFLSKFFEYSIALLYFLHFFLHSAKLSLQQYTAFSLCVGLLIRLDIRSHALVILFIKPLGITFLLFLRLSLLLNVLSVCPFYPLLLPILDFPLLWSPYFYQPSSLTVYCLVWL